MKTLSIDIETFSDVDMLHSLAAQVSYYSSLIQNNPEWEFAGVYAEM